MFKNLDPATAAALAAKGIYVKLYQLHDGKVPFEVDGEGVVEATEDRVSLLTHAMLTEDAEHLLRQQMLLYSVVMIQTCLSRPADIHR